jgi:hypothetical protein
VDGRQGRGGGGGVRLAAIPARRRLLAVAQVRGSGSVGVAGRQRRRRPVLPRFWLDRGDCAWMR